jgi:uncharacterized membrane protein
LWGLKDTFFFEEILFKGEYWKGVPPVVGSWIGGSTSQLVLKEVVACPEQVFLSVLVMDNLLVNIWTILMFQYIKRSHAFNRRLRITDRFRPGDVESGQTENIIPSWICLLVMIGLTVATSLLVEEFVIQILFLSAVGLSLSNLISGWNVSFALAAGSILIIVVMAILGLKLNFNTVSLDTTFVVFLIVWLVGHFLFMLFVARLLNLHMAWVSIASMANVGGIATAPAVTAAFRKEWMPHAIILAILSMATGTFWGILTIYLIEKLI